MNIHKKSRGGVRFFLLVVVASAVILGAVTKDVVFSFFKSSKGQELQQIIIKTKDTLPPIAIPLAQEKKLRGEEAGRVNVLILGIGGEGHPGSLLTDTIMLASFAPTSVKTDVFSIPRDLEVRVPQSQAFTKINALYEFSGKASFPNPGGIELLQQKLQEITGLSIQYYIIADFDALVQVIDDVGGVSIPQEKSLTDNRFPANERGYQTFAIQRGWRYLNGQEALKYVRTRNEGSGDFDRMRRQHTVLLALKQKIQGLHTLQDLPTILKIYQHIQNHIATNATTEELQRIWNITKGFSQGHGEFHVISSEPNNLLVSLLSSLGSQQAYVLRPKAGPENYSDIQKFIQTTIQQPPNP